MAPTLSETEALSSELNDARNYIGRLEATFHQLREALTIYQPIAEKCLAAKHEARVEELERALTQTMSANGHMYGCLGEKVKGGCSPFCRNARAALSKQGGFDCKRCGKRHYVGHCENPDPDALVIRPAEQEPAQEPCATCGGDGMVVEDNVASICRNPNCEAAQRLLGSTPNTEGRDG